MKNISDNSSALIQLQCSFLSRTLAHLSDSQPSIRIPLMISSVLNISLAVAATSGNALILAAIFKASNLRSPTDVLICALALTDLGIGILAHPWAAAQNIINIDKNKNLFCIAAGIHKEASLCFGVASLLIITLIAIERYLAIKLRNEFTTTVTAGRVKKAVFVCFFISALVTVGDTFELAFNLPVVILITAICVIVIFFAYGKIYREIRSRQRRIGANSQNNQQQIGRGNNPDRNLSSSATYRRSVNTSIAISVLLFVCFVPVLCNAVVANILGRTNKVLLGYEFTKSLLCLNSSLNPWMYVYRMESYRTAVVELLSRIMCK